MANCSNCSAPLLAHTSICEYCCSRNDVDLKGLHEYTVTKPESPRNCPACGTALQTINLSGDGKYYIERCERCMGLFFDPGELEMLLDKSVHNVFNIDNRGINRLIKDRSGQKRKVQYLKCPVCSNIMNRMNFGKKSGVIIDRCKAHGIWLDSGELKHIMEWRKAGGKMLHEKKVAMEKKIEETKKKKSAPLFPDQTYQQKNNNIFSLDDDDLFSSISNIVSKLFG